LIEIHAAAAFLDVPHVVPALFVSTTMAVDPCRIPSNPDVSGVGVRAAIYAQNLTCFLPVIVHLWDGRISRDELNGIKDQSIGMLAVAFAILFTTIILAKGAGGDQTITSYHAAVVLDLSWMNNTSTWIWFILYVHYQSKRDDPIKANWSEWCGALLAPLLELLGRNEAAGDSAGTSTNPPIRGIPQRIRGITQCIWRIAQRIWRFISAQPVLTLGSIHLSLMAAVGIWLWSDPSKFGQVLPPNCDLTLTVVGVPAHFLSQSLRIASLAMYSIVLIPGLNLIPPFIFFLTLHISYNWSRKWHQSFWKRWDEAVDFILKVFTLRKRSPLSDSERGSLSRPSSAGDGHNHSDVTTAYLPPVPAVFKDVAQPETCTSFSIVTAYPPSISPVSRPVSQPRTPHTAFLIVGLVLLVAINVLFIADIELTLRRNKSDQNGDDEWGFGQVLALLLLIIPLRDAWGALQDIREKLKGVQEQCAELLRRECQATPVVEELRRLIKKGAKLNEPLRLSGLTFGSALQLVAYYGKIELVQSIGQEEIEDTPGTVPIFNNIYNPNYLKVDNFKQRSNLQQRGGMSPW
jgi:hypothetical protein